MRSRYTAFSRGHVAHLLRTWHASTRPAHLELDPDTTWVRLAIVDTVAGGPFDREGVVEFVAMYEEAGQRHRLRERSRFVREGREWFYVDGVHSDL